MANFNKVQKNTPNAISYEGGAVYKKEPINEWLNMVFSSFLENGFYESADTQRQRFLDLTNTVAQTYGYEFVAKVAVFTRNELGMRSIAQLVAAWLNNKKFEYKRSFYRNFMHRPDDVAEIFAAIDILNQKRSHALVRGAADYLSDLNAYSLGKYKLNSHQYNMFDLINITHANSPVIDAYKNGILEAPDTWEVKISAQSNKEDRDVEWKRLVEEGKLGYMALIRNLNNILDIEGLTMDWIGRYLVPQLEDINNIKKSLIFPYRIYTAYKNLRVKPLSVVCALNNAFSIATSNMPQLEGNTAVILDISGSMTSPISSHSNISILEAGACFATAIFLQNPKTTTLAKFGDYGKVMELNPLVPAFDIVNQMCKNDGLGHGTYIESAFRALQRTHVDYNRMFLISDMQVMDTHTYGYFGDSVVKLYHQLFHQIPVYSFDLGNYSTQIVSEYDHIHYLTTLSDQVFKFIDLLESGVNLVSYISQFDYC